jgi:hypothetical protein
VTTHAPQEPPPIAETVAKAMLALLPVVGGAAVVVWEDARKHIAARLRKTANEVVDAVGAERLAQRFIESPEFEALAVNAMESAARTGYEAKRRLLARVVINAARDDALVDESVLIQQALRELEGPHIRAAERLRSVYDSCQMTPEYLAEYPSQDPDRLLQSKRSEDCYEASRHEPAPVIATLVRTGMAAPPMIMGGGVGVAYITGFGRAVLDYLRDVMVLGT